MKEEKEKSQKKYLKAAECPITNAVNVIGGKWKPIIIWVLMKETCRFSELCKIIPGISIKVLSRQLKELEQDGIVKKKIFPVVPPKVEYSLTDKGAGLTAIMHGLAAWSNTHLNNYQGTVEPVS